MGYGHPYAASALTAAAAFGRLRGTRRRNQSVLSLAHRRNPLAKVSAWEFKKLERKVRQNQRETHVLRVNDELIDQVGTGYEETTVNISTAITGNGNFREQVLGDKFRFKNFKLSMSSDCSFVRIILYRHKRTDSSLSLASYTFPHTTFYDPSPLKAVYWDKSYIRNSGDTQTGTTRPNPTTQWVINLNKSLNFMQVINSDNLDSIESPPLKMLIITKGATGADTVYSYEVAYQNI